MSSENVVVYKDLDPFTEFSTDDLIVTHRIIVDTLGKLQELYSTKQEEINDHNANMRVGFSVSSFISTLSYENKILGEHISLYSNYLSFYHSSQRKYLDNVLGKITNFMREIEEDILTNHKSYKKETITIVESIVEEEVKDEVKEEEVKQEEVKQEEVKEEEFKNEEVKNEEVKNEEVKVQSEVKNEEVKTEEVKTDEEPDEINSVLINRDDGFQTVGRGGKNGKSKRR
jgi:glutamyl/glutaminyl-tRNA synthetase